MDEKGEIVSSCDVDENITLQIWTKGFSPRLVVFNKKQNTRKLIRLSWLEKQDRKLSVKTGKRGASAEYTLSDLLPVLQRILSEYAVYTSFKTRLWKFAVLFEKSFHTPAIVSEKGELALLSEDKRASLWIADMTGDKRGEGFFRPFFPLSEKEKKVLSEEGIPITGNLRGVDDLLKTGILRKLSAADPIRWHNPLHLVVAGMLLGFSFCGEDGSDFVDELWQISDVEAVSGIKVGDARLMGLGHKFVGYTRHFAAFDRIEMDTSIDSDKLLQSEGYTRRRRIEFPAGLLDGAEYSVTFFEREDGMMALGCKPKGVPDRRNELIYRFPGFLYEQALGHDSLGGAHDDYFTVAQLASAKKFEAWAGSIRPYVASFAGLI